MHLVPHCRMVVLSRHQQTSLASVQKGRVVREREREKDMYMYIHVYIYTHTYIYICFTLYVYLLPLVPLPPILTKLE